MRTLSFLPWSHASLLPTKVLIVSPEIHGMRSVFPWHAVQRYRRIGLEIGALRTLVWGRTVAVRSEPQTTQRVLSWLRRGDSTAKT